MMKMMKKSVLVLAVCVIVGMSASAVAGPIVPDWRGDTGTTHQVWGFETDANPAVPEVVNNPNGDPLATIEADNPDEMEWFEVLDGAEGVWKTQGDIKLFIPNTDNTGSDTYKEIIIQIVYKGDDITEDAWARYAADGSPLSPGILPIESEELDNGYRYSRWEITIEPNPTEEMIYVLPFYCNLFVDSIEVDTACIPEPATMLLLGLGGLLTVRKRK